MQAAATTAEAQAGREAAAPAEIAREQGGEAAGATCRGANQQTMDILHLLASLDFTQGGNAGNADGAGAALENSHMCAVQSTPAALDAAKPVALTLRQSKSAMRLAWFAMSLVVDAPMVFTCRQQ